MVLTKSQFFEDYAEGSNLTLEELRESGLNPFKCRCEHASCKWWQMLTIGQAIKQFNLGLMHPSDFADGASGETI